MVCRWVWYALVMHLCSARMCRCKKRVPPCFTPAVWPQLSCRGCLMQTILAQCWWVAHQLWQAVLILRITLRHYALCLVVLRHCLMVRSPLLIGQGATYRGPTFPMDCVMHHQGRYQSRQGSGVRFQLACSWISFITS